MNRFDRQDVFTVLGLALLHAGVAMIYVPAALILGGLFCLVFVIFLERIRQAEEQNARPQLVSRSRE